MEVYTTWWILLSNTTILMCISQRNQNRKWRPCLVLFSPWCSTAWGPGARTLESASDGCLISILLPPLLLFLLRLDITWTRWADRGRKDPSPLLYSFRTRFILLFHSNESDWDEVSESSIFTTTFLLNLTYIFALLPLARLLMALKGPRHYRLSRMLHSTAYLLS